MPAMSVTPTTSRPAAKVRSLSCHTMFVLKAVDHKLVIEPIDPASVRLSAAITETFKGHKFARALESLDELPMVGSSVVLRNYQGAHFNTANIYSPVSESEFPMVLVSPLDTYIVNGDFAVLQLERPVTLEDLCAWYFKQAIIVHRWVDVWGLARKSNTAAKSKPKAKPKPKPKAKTKAKTRRARDSDGESEAESHSESDDDSAEGSESPASEQDSFDDIDSFEASASEDESDQESDQESEDSDTDD